MPTIRFDGATGPFEGQMALHLAVDRRRWAYSPGPETDAITVAFTAAELRDLIMAAQVALGTLERAARAAHIGGAAQP